MIKGFCIVLGVGLTLLWLAGLNMPGAVTWVAWADLVAGIVSFGTAVMIPSSERDRKHLAQVGGPILLSVALFIVWIFGVAMVGSNSLLWWNFGFAAVFLALGIAGSVGVTPRNAGRNRDTDIWTNKGFQNHRYFGGVPDPMGYSNWPLYGLGYFGLPVYDQERGREHEPMGPRSYQRSDARIEEEINERLYHQREFDAQDITVHVKAGEVILEGDVKSRRARRVAEHLVDSVWGVKEIENHLQVQVKPKRHLTEVA